MKHITVSLMVILAGAVSLTGAQAKAPYAGQQERDIKALSPAQVKGYLNGAGMGFAKAAELNHYPGPKHVMELAVKLGVTEAQMAETEKIFNKMKKETTELGKLLVDKEKKLDDLFASKQITPVKLDAMVAEAAKLLGGIRAAHLRTHIEMKNILTTEQVAKYDELRGYSSGEHKRDHQMEH